MSGIYIPNMEMPKNCGSCPILHLTLKGFECYMGVAISKYQRPEDCPLVPVPDHGRLIDATQLQAAMMEMVQSGMYGLEDMIDAVIEAPTIIPVDGGAE